MLPCEYAHLADHGDTPPCWGDVLLARVTEAATGDPRVALVCQGHRGNAEHGSFDDAPPSPDGVVFSVTKLSDPPEDLPGDAIGEEGDSCSSI